MVQSVYSNAWAALTGKTGTTAAFAADYDIPGLGKGTMPAWFSFKPVSR